LSESKNFCTYGTQRAWELLTPRGWEFRHCLIWMCLFLKGAFCAPFKKRLGTRCATFSIRPPFGKQATPPLLSQRGYCVYASSDWRLRRSRSLNPPILGDFRNSKSPRIGGLGAKCRMFSQSQRGVYTVGPERRGAKTRLGSPAPQKGEEVGRCSLLLSSSGRHLSCTSRIRFYFVRDSIGVANAVRGEAI